MTQNSAGNDKTFSFQIDPRTQMLLTLVTLQKNARHREKMSELEFLMVNQTFNLVPYRHCVFWRLDNSDAVSIETASGLVQLDPNGPYILWLKKTVARLLREKHAVFSLNVVNQPGAESFV